LELLGLDVCFTEEEIWAVVRDTPDEKEPRPEGFTGLFYEWAWEVIKVLVWISISTHV